MTAKVTSKTDFKEDKIVHEEDEFKQVQDNITMYISDKGSKGVIRMIHEIVNNSLDEIIHPETRKSDVVKGDKINIFVDEQTNKIAVEDNGRGMPFESMVTAATKKHASTKFGRSANPFAAGTHGVGVKVTIALSSYASILSYKGKKSKLIEFHDCKLTDHEIQKEKKERYGTITTFVPTEKYLGPFELRAEDVEDWLRHLSYQYPADDIVIDLNVVKKDGSTYTKSYQKLTLVDNVKFMSIKPEFNPIYMESKTSYPKKVMYDKDDLDHELMELRVAFTYDKTVSGELIDSYCNYVMTNEGGYHVDGVRKALSRFFLKETREVLKGKAKADKLEIIGDDIKNGLVMSVELLHTTPDLSGQTKDKVSNKEVESYAYKLTMERLNEFFKTNNQLLKKICELIILNAKARIGSSKIKGVEIKRNTFLSDNDIPGFINTSDRNYDGYCELIITEGKSVNGNIGQACNKTNQAIYAIYGITKNVVGKTWQEAMTTKAIPNLVHVIGCGIGPTFDITKCRWKKIIIETDFDVDGHNITSFLCAFFATMMPELLKAGLVYKAIPPLYMVDPKYVKKLKCPKFLYDKVEYYRTYFQIIADSIDLLVETDSDTKNVEKLSKGEVVEWLLKNRYYLDHLESLCKVSGIDNNMRGFMEVICDTMVSYDMERKEGYDHFYNHIQKAYQELEVDPVNHVISGAIHKKPITLIVDRLFRKNATKFMNTLRENPTMFVSWKRKGEEEYRRVPISQFLAIVFPEYKIEIKQRFKGLGEMNPLDLFEAAISPLTRRLVKLTTDDWNHTLKTVEQLHGKKNIKYRKDMLMNINATYEDIDS